MKMFQIDKLADNKNCKAVITLRVLILISKPYKCLRVSVNFCPHGQKIRQKLHYFLSLYLTLNSNLIPNSK